MKATVFDKILLALLLIVLIAAALAAAAVAAGIIGADMLKGLADGIFKSTVTRIVIGAVALVLLAIALRMFIAFLGGRRSEQPRSAIVRVDELGTSSITLAAIDGMVQRHCLNTPNVLSCMSSIRLGKDNRLGIALKLNVGEDVNIPELTAGIQSSLKDHLEALTGVAVADINTLVLHNAPERTTVGPRSAQYKR